MQQQESVARDTGTGLAQAGARSYFLFRVTHYLRDRVMVNREAQIKLLLALGVFIFVLCTPEPLPSVHVSMSRGWSLVSADVTVQCPGNSSHSLSAKQTWPRELMWGWMSSTKSMEGELQ